MLFVLLRRLHPLAESRHAREAWEDRPGADTNPRALPAVLRIAPW